MNFNEIKNHFILLYFLKKYRKYILYIVFFCLNLFFLPYKIYSQNNSITSFSEAKNILEEIIYSSDEERITLYCQAKFDKNKNVTLPDGFTTNKYLNRIGKIEWEHVVPVENFGRTFTEWRDGHPLCIDKKGNSFKPAFPAYVTKRIEKTLKYKTLLFFCKRFHRYKLQYVTMKNFSNKT